jgi:farnesyl diphosphate synthase
VALAMHLCNIPSSYTPTPSSAPIKPYSLARSILIPLGEYFQIQDDFLDYSGTPEQIGKVGTDILDNKCSWCINTALAVATPEQRAILDENYGRKDKEREERVKRVFEEVGLAERFRTYEEDAYRKISGLIESIPEASQGPRASAPVLKRRVFTSFLDKIYKRTK